MQVTSEEYAAAREELRAIDARPVKKVMEAKARKQKRLRMRLTQVRGWALCPGWGKSTRVGSMGGRHVGLGGSSRLGGMVSS